MNQNEPTPVILIHNQLEDRYELTSSDGSIFFQINAASDDAVNVLTRYAEERYDIEVVPINGLRGFNILRAAAFRKAAELLKKPPQGLK